MCDFSTSGMLQSGNIIGALYVEDLETHLRSSGYDLSLVKTTGGVAMETAENNVGGIVANHGAYMNITDIYNPSYLMQEVGVSNAVASSFIADPVSIDEVSVVSKEIAYDRLQNNYEAQKVELLNGCEYNDVSKCVSSATLENVIPEYVLGGEQQILSGEESLAIFTIDSVEPIFVDPTEGNTVEVIGSGFVESVLCSIGAGSGVSEYFLKTVVISSTIVHCQVPAKKDEDSHKISLSLEILADEVNDHAQSNTVSLFYDMMNVTQLTVDYVSQSMVDVEENLSIVSALCLSFDGCDTLTTNGAPQSGMVEPLLMMNWKIGVDSTNDTVVSELAVYFMEPNVVSLAENGTTIPVHVYGSNFSLSEGTYCVLVDFSETSFPCITVSDTLLQCPMKLDQSKMTNSSFLLGYHQLSLFGNCFDADLSTNVFVHSLSIVPTHAHDAAFSGVDSVFDSAISSKYPIIASMKPSAGSVSGGTSVSIHGENLGDVKYCGFRNVDTSLLNIVVSSVT